MRAERGERGGGGGGVLMLRTRTEEQCLQSHE